jgi:hypothetical protein
MHGLSTIIEINRKAAESFRRKAAKNAGSAADQKQRDDELIARIAKDIKSKAAL